jgi:hypothetical protein
MCCSRDASSSLSRKSSGMSFMLVQSLFCSEMLSSSQMFFDRPQSLPQCSSTWLDLLSAVHHLPHSWHSLAFFRDVHICSIRSISLSTFSESFSTYVNRARPSATFMGLPIHSICRLLRPCVHGNVSSRSPPSVDLFIPLCIRRIHIPAVIYLPTCWKDFKMHGWKECFIKQWG